MDLEEWVFFNCFVFVVFLTSLFFCDFLLGVLGCWWNSRSSFSFVSYAKLWLALAPGFVEFTFSDFFNFECGKHVAPHTHSMFRIYDLSDSLTTGSVTDQTDFGMRADSTQKKPQKVEPVIRTK